MEIRKIDILTGNGETVGRISIGSGVVIIRNDKVLLVRGKGGDDFKFPGGHIIDSESLQDAAIRESKEELGVDVELIGEPMLYLFQVNETDDILLVHYLAEAHGEPKASTEIEEILWAPLHGLPENCFENVAVILKKLHDNAV